MLPDSGYAAINCYRLSTAHMMSALGVSSFHVFHALLLWLRRTCFWTPPPWYCCHSGPAVACWCILCLAAIGGSGPCIPKSHFVGSLAQKTLPFRLFPTTSMKQNSIWFVLATVWTAWSWSQYFLAVALGCCDPGWANYCILRMRPFQGNQVSFSLFSCFILLPKDIVELPCHFWYSTSDLWNIETSLWNRVDNMLRLDDIGRISFYVF